MAQEAKNQGAPAMDAEVARMVVEQKLATSDEVQTAREHRQQVDPSDLSLAQVLVDKGFVTRTQIDRLKKAIEETRNQQIPGYVLLGKLGAGAMATVFKARQVSLDRTVAIKVLPKRLSENAEYVERFYREGKAAAKLNHANIVQAIDVGEANGYHYFVMEFVEGTTVGEELDRGKVFAEAEALKIIIQIARALDHAHSQGLIHRDVKPRNIMLAKDGTAKLADMGLARAAADQELAQAEAGRAFGTPYYISPEQIRGEVNIDFRADIYSLGATLYHMVTGRRPFEAPTPAAVMHKHLKEELTPPDHLNTSLSSGVGEVVEVMMAKNRDRRYGSTADLLVDLEAIARGEAPLQARKRIDQEVLSGLAHAVDTPQADDDRQTAPAPATSGGSWMIYALILGAALIVSILLNIVLLVTG